MPGEVRGQDANHRGVVVIHGEVTSNHLAGAAKAPLPQTVTQDHYVWRVRLAIIWCECSSHNRVHPKHRKEVRSCNLCRDLFRLAVAGQLAAEIKEGRHIFEDVILFFPVEEVSEINGIL